MSDNGIERMITEERKRRALGYSVFFPGYPATLESLLKPEAASFAYSVNGLTKVQMSPPAYHPMLTMLFSIIRVQQQKLLYSRLSTKSIPEPYFSQMIRDETVTLSLIVVLYVYSYDYCK